MVYNRQDWILSLVMDRAIMKHSSGVSKNCNPVADLTESIADVNGSGPVALKITMMSKCFLLV